MTVQEIENRSKHIEQLRESFKGLDQIVFGGKTLFDLLNSAQRITDQRGEPGSFPDSDIREQFDLPADMNGVLGRNEYITLTADYKKGKPHNLNLIFNSQDNPNAHLLIQFTNPKGSRHSLITVGLGDSTEKKPEPETILFRTDFDENVFGTKSKKVALNSPSLREVNLMNSRGWSANRFEMGENEFAFVINTDITSTEIHLPKKVKISRIKK